MHKMEVASTILFLSLAVRAPAQIPIPGADGSDGALNPTSDTVIDLGTSPVGAWNGENPDPDPGGWQTGVYDDKKWAVVFRYSSVNIPAGVTVSFTNRPCGRPPVVWLVNGNVNIEGTLSLDGKPDAGTNGYGDPSEPGPGGFRGGQLPSSGEGTAGLGPGGASYNTSCTLNHGSGGGYGCLGIVPPPIGATHNGCPGSTVGPLYGSESIVPLIGGSGGACSRPPGNAVPGAGAGAILIACAQTVSLGNTGRVRANGGNGIAGLTGCGYEMNPGPGAGGSIRIVAEIITGGVMAQGTHMQALGGWAYSGRFQCPGLYFRGGCGRIRLEAFQTSIPPGSISDPPVAPGPFPDPVILWPESTAPTIRINGVNTQSVPQDPCATLGYPDTDVTVSSPNPVTIRFQCSNVPIPPAPPARFWIRVVPVYPDGGQDFRLDDLDVSYISGDFSSSEWETNGTATELLVLPRGSSAIQGGVSLP